MVNNAAILPARRRLASDCPAPRTRLPVEDKELMQRILEVVRDPHFQMAKGRDFSSLDGRDPAEPFAKAKDVGVDRETRTLETKENHTGSGLGPDTGVFHQLGHCVFLAETVEVVEG